MKKGDLTKHAKHELKVLCQSAKSDNRPVVEPFTEEIVALLKKFSEQGYSPTAAPIAGSAIIDTLRRLMNGLPICPLMGIAPEWNDISKENGGVTMFQNNRCAAVFKDLAGPYFLDAVVFKEGNTVFTSSAPVKIISGGGIVSKQPITFPFKPKTFYIDVFRRGDQYVVEDERQLAAVWEYYPKASKTSLFTA